MCGMRANRLRCGRQRRSLRVSLPKKPSSRRRHGGAGATQRRRRRGRMDARCGRHHGRCPQSSRHAAIRCSNTKCNQIDASGRIHSRDDCFRSRPSRRTMQAGHSPLTSQEEIHFASLPVCEGRRRIQDGGAGNKMASPIEGDPSLCPAVDTRVAANGGSPRWGR